MLGILLEHPIYECDVSKRDRRVLSRLGALGDVARLEDLSKYPSPPPTLVAYCITPMGYARLSGPTLLRKWLRLLRNGVDTAHCKLEDFSPLENLGRVGLCRLYWTVKPPNRGFRYKITDAGEKLLQELE